MKAHKIKKTNITEKYTIFYLGKEYNVLKSKELYYPNKYYISVKTGYKTYNQIGTAENLIKAKKIIKNVKVVNV